MESQIPIKWPSAGIVEGWSFSDQPEGSAREYQNVRTQDPTNNRLRGAQRSGQSKYLTSPLKALNTKVADLTSFTVDNRQVSYTAISSGSETTTWSEPADSTAGADDVVNVKTDRQGNVYALYRNASLKKFSADGQEVWSLTIPVADTNHSCRALYVDEFDLVFVGVSSGGDQLKAKLFCYEQLIDNKVEKLWELTTKAYVEDIVVTLDKLYTCQNRVDRKKSYVRIYEFFDGPNPELSQEWRVPHPVNSIAVKKDGSVLVACEPAGDTTGLYWRDPDPKYPLFGPDSVDWTPLDLENSKRRIWAWYRADDIDETDMAQAEVNDGIEVLRFRDGTENGRHFRAAVDEDDTGPILSLDACLEHKGLRFTNTSVNSHPFQSMKTDHNYSIQQTLADGQRTMVPQYTDSQFLVLIAFRPSSTTPSGGSVPRWTWGGDKSGAYGDGRSHNLFINSAAALTNPSGSVGSIAWIMGPDGVTSGGDGGGLGTIVRAFTFTPASTDPDVLIVAQLHDGGVATTHPNVSMFCVNGNPLLTDIFVANAQNNSLEPSYLGVVRENGAEIPTTPAANGFLGDILEIIVLDKKTRTSNTEGVVGFDNLEWDDTSANQTNNEFTRLVGYLAHKYGAQSRLPMVGETFPHPYGITGSSPDQMSGPPNQAASGVNTAQALANKRFGCVVKYSPEGKIKWTANEQELQSGSRTGGYGYAVAVNLDGNIYSLGPNPTGAAGETTQVRMIVDKGDDFSILVADGAWSTAYPSNFNQTYKYPRIDVDEFGNLYLPFPANGGSIAGFRVYKKDGTLLHDGTAGAGTESFCVAVDRRIPDYRSDLTTKRVEHVFVGTNQAAIGADNIFKKRLVSSAQAGGSPRSQINLGVSGGDIVKFTTSGVTTPSGGSGALDSTAKYVQSTHLFRRAYWTDGRQYRFYDAISNTVAEYKCLSAGAIPSRCALIETWRGRIVLARSADEPQNWFMSKKDEPTNYDFFPATPSETDAVAGNNSPAGLCPDIINTIVPYSEDVLVFGGDRSIWMLVGDPAAGGRLELVSDITGMAFGRPWCKDPNGVVYFLGSRGGMYQWVPGAKPERISLHRIERQLQDIDFSAYFVRLVWNHQDEGVHIFQCPFGAGGTIVSHWFWEQKADAFAKDIFGSSAATNIQPCAAVVIDGDDIDDRVLLIGGEDGQVRRWNKDRKYDDTRTDGTTKIPIDSIVTVFPIQPDFESHSGMETQFHGLTVTLADAGDGCRYELFASDEPESFGIARKQGVLRPGRNAPIWDRVSGTYCGLRLRNSGTEERWAFERAYIYATPAGMARTRARN
jgi:hypothetical protein